MKSTYFIVFLLVGCGIVLAEEKYSTKYDNVDVDAILSNARLSKQYSACMLGNGPCSPEGRAFKQILPDALATNCAKCNDKQKIIIRKILNHTRQNHPDKWEMFAKIYDPEDKYKESFKEFLNQE